ncbi:MAG: CDP-diacylglycerol O-phosphatidyltransferase [Myxococcota bacterium]
MAVLLAWLVHLYTASSVLVGLWAVWASFAGQLQRAAFLMLVALAIDATDGALARAIDVRRRIPSLDGRRLDDICDYFTYVLVPTLFLLEAGLLPQPAWAALPVLASAYGFSQTDAKTEDHFFRGWPSYWNVLAVYLHLLHASQAVASIGVLICSIAIFVPLRYVYPSRTRTLRPLTLVVLGLWLVGLGALVLQPQPRRLWVLLSLLGPAYYLGLSLALSRARRPAGAGLP